MEYESSAVRAEGFVEYCTRIDTVLRSLEAKLKEELED